MTDNLITIDCLNQLGSFHLPKLKKTTTDRFPVRPSHRSDLTQWASRKTGAIHFLSDVPLLLATPYTPRTKQQEPAWTLDFHHTIMSNLMVTEIKAFVPSKDFELSKQFYKDLGFSMTSEGGGVAYFHFAHVSFLLQDYCVPNLAENFMMHLLVQDVDAWWRHVHVVEIESKYKVKVGAIEDQAWGMRDFCIYDPSGVLWRIGQNIG